MPSKFIQWWTVLGPRHSGFQKEILRVVLVPGVVHILWKLAEIVRAPGKFPLSTFLSTLVLLLWIWTVIAALLTACFYFASYFLSLDLWLYYRLWLRVVKPRFFRLSERESNIVKSFRYFMPDDDHWKNKRPCFIEREDLLRRRFWPGWVFSIVTVFGQHKIGQVVLTDNNKKKKWELQVDLTGESYGIYSNDGKQFLRSEFLGNRPAIQKEIVERSQRIHDFMKPEKVPGSRWSWNEDGGVLPIRWASGGFLPLIWFKNDYWVLFFLRDRRPPIGLNIANGASENKNEYKNIRSLMAREFCEEVVVLNGRPIPGFAVLQIRFESDEFRELVNPQFTIEHARIRRSVDGLAIDQTEEREALRKMRLLETPFVLSVRFHETNLVDTQIDHVSNIIYSINPAEFGIEIIKLCTLELRDTDYILDGEFDLSNKVLIRQLPILLKVNYLFDIFKSKGSLGSYISEGNSADGKLLDAVPASQCYIFDADVDLRRARREGIQSELESGPPAQLRRNLEWERKNIVSDWLERYDKSVSRIKEEGLSGNEQADKELRTLCPVAWKALELAFSHGILKEVTKKK